MHSPDSDLKKLLRKTDRLYEALNVSPRDRKVMLRKLSDGSKNNLDPEFVNFLNECNLEELKQRIS